MAPEDDYDERQDAALGIAEGPDGWTVTLEEVQDGKRARRRATFATFEEAFEASMAAWGMQ